MALVFGRAGARSGRNRDSGITGILRRWRVYISGFIQVELQSFSVD